MKFKNFTDKSKKIIDDAQNLALRKGNPEFWLEHLLKTLLKEDLIKLLINDCEGEMESIVRSLNKELDKIPFVKNLDSGNTTLASATVKVFEKAKIISERAQDSFVTIDRLLQAIVVVEENIVSKILRKKGVTEKKLCNIIKELRKGRKANTAVAENSYNALRKYSTDLTEIARSGKIDPVIGRDEEIRRIIQVLCRKIKNNPVLIGEPGVGKTAIIEGWQCVW